MSSRFPGRRSRSSRSNRRRVAVDVNGGRNWL
jgi:hypothetical protein